MLGSHHRHGNAMAGAKYHGKGQSGPLGWRRFKTEPQGDRESPTGYRSRGPSAARQDRVMFRRAYGSAADV